MRRGCRSILLLVLVALLGTAWLTASESVRIGLVPVHTTVGNQSLLSDLDTHIQRALQQQPSSDSYMPLVTTRVDNRVQRDLLNRKHTAWGGSGQLLDSVFSSSEQMPKPEFKHPLPYVFERIEPPPEIAQALAEHDAVVADYLMRKHSLDALLVLILEPFEMLSRLRVSEFRSDSTRTTIHEEISLPQDSDSLLQASVLAIVSHYREDELSMVVFAPTAPGLEVLLDEERVDLFGNLLLTTEGEHNLEARALGTQSKLLSLELQPGSITHIDLELEPQKGRPLLITSNSGTAFVSIPSHGTMQLPNVVESISTPNVLYGRADGMSPMIVHMMDSTDEISFAFQPPWLSPKLGTAREQRSLYASLGRSLLFGGLAILVDSISRSVVSDPAQLSEWQPVLLASAGAFAVSLFDTGSRLFAYYQKTKYSSRY